MVETFGKEIKILPNSRKLVGKYRINQNINKFNFNYNKFIELLRQYALDDDKEFFSGLWSTKITFGNRCDINIISRSFIKENKLKLLKYFFEISPDINAFTLSSKKSLLHYACEYAAPKAVKALLANNK